MAASNPNFDFRGINHLALVCQDMAKTVEFYRDILGMPLIKTLELPGGRGQHFFFDVGNGDSIAFFWFSNGRSGVKGVSAPEALPGEGDFTSAHGSMNHIAINVSADKFDEYCERLVDSGVKVSKVLNHDDSETNLADELHPGVFVRSIYFFDPDGICLELAAWTKDFDDSDVAHDPMQADGSRREGLITRRAPVSVN